MRCDAFNTERSILLTCFFLLYDVNHYIYRYVIIEYIVDNVRLVDWLYYYYKTTRFFLNWSRNSKNVGSHLIGTYNGCRSRNKRAYVVVRYFIRHTRGTREDVGVKSRSSVGKQRTYICAYIKCDIIHGWIRVRCDTCVARTETI